MGIKFAPSAVCRSASPFFDVIGGGGDVLVSGEVGDAGVVGVAAIIAARAGGEGAAGDAEVQHLMKVRDEQGGAVFLRLQSFGDGRAGGFGGADVAQFLEPAIEEAGRVGRIELGESGGVNGAVGGKEDKEIEIARRLQAVKGGGDGVGETAGGHRREGEL